MFNEQLDTISVKGYVKRIRFQNSDNGFCILIVEDENSFQDVIVTGTSFSVFEGSYIVAKGSFVNHPKFGKQLKATVITETIPADSQGVEKYLASGILPGIGEKTAKKIDGALEKMLLRKF